MVARYIPERGDLIKLSLDPVLGHEQAGWRPALVLSPSEYNRKTHLALVVPITNQAKGYPFEVALPSKLKTTGVVLSDQLKCVAWKERNARYIESATNAFLESAQEKLGLLLGIEAAG